MRYPNQAGTECLIWRGHPALVLHVNSGFGYFVERSQRAGGDYIVDRPAKYLLDEIDDEQHRARMTTYLANQRKMGVRAPQLTTSVIEETRESHGLSADERAERLLRFLAQQTALLNEWEVVLSWRHEANTASLQSWSQETHHHQEIPASDT